MKYGDKVEVRDYAILPQSHFHWTPGYRYLRHRYYPGVGTLVVVAIKTQLWGWMRYNFPPGSVRPALDAARRSR